MGMFEACAAAQKRGQEVYLQFTCQPLSFDFTLAAAYPFTAIRLSTRSRPTTVSS